MYMYAFLGVDVRVCWESLNKPHRICGVYYRLSKADIHSQNSYIYVFDGLLCFANLALKHTRFATHQPDFL
jgi:hypothetical protein